MGDVVGHGLDAAIVMGRLRSALRAYALEHDSPAEVLHRLDRKICHFEPDALATVLFGVAAPPYDVWEFSSAGHFPPMVASVDAEGESIDMWQDQLLGLTPDAVRHNTTIQLPPDGLLCLFTDGLVERRPAPGQTDHNEVAENLDRLAEALAGAEDPEMVCIRVLTHVVGQHLTEDDVAVLVARRLT
jgi:serine phosphatase RsbU (regulator of sigma subunit)